METLRNIPGPTFLVLFPVLAIGAAVLMLVLRQLLRPEGTALEKLDDPYDVALIRGGKRGLFEAIIARLLHLEVIDITVSADRDGTLSLRNAPTNVRPGGEWAVITCAREGETVRDAYAQFDDSVEQRTASLVEAGAMMSVSTFLGYQLATFSPLLLAGFLGVSKAALGLSHGRPIGLLVIELGLFIFLCAVTWPGATRATKSSHALITEAQREYAGLRDAMGTSAIDQWTPNQLAYSVALFGFAMLATSPLGYAAGPMTMVVPDASSSGGCGSSCGGGCGGGCGGCGS